MAKNQPPLAVVAAFVALASVMPTIVQAQPTLPAPPEAGSVDEPAKATQGRRVVTRRAVAVDKQPVVQPAPQLPHEHHPWARFQPGAWRRIKITTESFDANGRFLGRSVTSQTETLKSVEETTCTLEVVSIVEIGGKRLRGAVQTVTYDLLCNEPCDAVIAQRLDAANISLDGAVIPVERWSVQYGEADNRHTELLYYSPDRSPYVLRREEQSAAGEANVVSTHSVTRVDAPLLLDGGIVPSSHVTAVEQDGPNQTNRFEVLCDAVPGGLFSASSTERDASGRRVRWSAIELEAFGDTQEEATPKRIWPPFRRLRDRGEGFDGD